MMIRNTARATTVLETRELDAIVATAPENVYYLSDYDCLTSWTDKASNIFVVYVPDGSDPHLITPALEAEAVYESGATTADIVLVGKFARPVGNADNMTATGSAVQSLVSATDAAESSMSALHSRLSALPRNARVALDETGLLPNQWHEIETTFPNMQFVPGNEVIWDIRMVKTSEEIRRLRRAAEVTEAAMVHALSTVREGSTDADLVTRYLEHVVREGALPSFNCIGSGPRSAYPHINLGSRSIRRGDPVRYDVGCTVDHYHSDLARTVVFGTPTRQQQMLWDLMRQGEEQAIKLLKPGARIEDIFNAAMEPGLSAGLESFFRVHCGHGIGLTVYDPPLIMAESSERSIYQMPRVTGTLEKDMVINIETGYYVQGIGGFQCEDTLLVTDEGSTPLSAAPKVLDMEKWLATT